MKKSFFYVVLFSLCMAGCKNKLMEGDNIKINNKLNKNIVCVLGYNYPDLSFNFTNKQTILANNNLFEIGAGQVKELDTLGLCRKEIFDKYVKRNLLMLFVFDKDKLADASKLEDALVERYYFSYTQLIKTNGIITVDASSNNL